MPYASKAEQQEYQRRWVAARRSAYFETQACLYCEAVEYLELHHMDPSLKVTHRIWSMSEANRSKELLKCIVLCKTCHQSETNKQRASRQPCGTRAKYKAGCKCSECRAANAAYRRQYLAR